MSFIDKTAPHDPAELRAQFDAVRLRIDALQARHQELEARLALLEQLALKRIAEGK